jgi:formate--tetrahydrofolate ligase
MGLAGGDYGAKTFFLSLKNSGRISPLFFPGGPHMMPSMSALPTIDLVSQSLGLHPDHLVCYGRDKAKVSLEALPAVDSVRGKLILVSAITPTPAGEGKTTVSIGLAQGLKKTGRSVALALRQPSMGPVFGRKGGATGGGRSSLTPAESINLHFNGDFHAITAAHNLLASAIDNQLFLGSSRLTPEGVTWKRVLDMNDRALRRITVGSKNTQRASGFDITAASEVMAVFCLAESRADLRARLNRMVVGFTPEGDPVTAAEFRVTGAMMAILRDALAPNLVQSLEGVPAFVHGGPFANIAHGCNSILATRMAMGYADFAVTEAGFAFDLGGEKFFHIKCRQSGLAPAVIVLVATVRALKMHGGTALADLTVPDVAAVGRGLENLAAHVNSASHFARPVVVAINQFGTDHEDELAAIHDWCKTQGLRSATANVFGAGGEGAQELADLVAEAAAGDVPPLPFLYQTNDPVATKLNAIATKIYGAEGVVLTPEAQARLALFEKHGFDKLPLCMAKTQNSLSDQPALLGRPRGFTITVRDFELAAGAGFLVALTGTMMRMPALPKVPAAERIEVLDDGTITGLMS